MTDRDDEMTPYVRFLTDPTLTPGEKLDDDRWRKSATPEQIQRADALTALWYQEKDAARVFKEDMAVLMTEKYRG